MKPTEEKEWSAGKDQRGTGVSNQITLDLFQSAKGILDKVCLQMGLEGGAGGGMIPHILVEADPAPGASQAQGEECSLLREQGNLGE